MTWHSPGAGRKRDASNRRRRAADIGNMEDSPDDSIEARTERQHSAGLVDTLCVELTTRCPLHCVHCSANAGPAKVEHMSPDTFRMLVGRIGPLLEIYLSGGEPFEHPALDQLVLAARQAADTVVIYSSGTRIFGDSITHVDSKTVTWLIAGGVVRVDVSIYSPYADEHDSITRRSGSFDATLRTLRMFRALGMPFGVHFVPIVAEGARLSVTSALAREIGAVRFHVLGVAPQGRGRHLATPSSTRFLQQLAELRNDAEQDVLLSRGLRRQLGWPTTARDDWRAAFVDVTGRLHPGEGHRDGPGLPVDWARADREDLKRAMAAAAISH